MWYLFTEDLVHHGKLNLCQPIPERSSSSTSVLIMAGVTADGNNNVASPRSFKSLVSSYVDMGEALSGRVPVIGFICPRFFLWGLLLSSPAAVRSKRFSPYYVILSNPIFQLGGWSLVNIFRESTSSTNFFRWNFLQSGFLHYVFPGVYSAILPFWDFCP